MTLTLHLMQIASRKSASDFSLFNFWLRHQCMSAMLIFMEGYQIQNTKTRRKLDFHIKVKTSLIIAQDFHFTYFSFQKIEFGIY